MRPDANPAVRLVRAAVQPRLPGRAGRPALVNVAPLRVGVLGAGTVGREVVRALLEPSLRLSPSDGAPLVLAGVAVRDVPRAVASGIPEALLTDAPAHFVASPEVDVLVELMGGAEPARSGVTDRQRACAGEPPGAPSHLNRARSRAMS